MSKEPKKADIKGLKRLTKPNSEPMKLAAGGKELVPDRSKQRKYKVPGEKGYRHG